MFPKTGKGPNGVGVGNWVEYATPIAFTPLKGQVVAFDLALSTATTNDEATAGNGLSLFRAAVTADQNGSIGAVRAVVLDDYVAGQPVRVLIKGRCKALVGTSNSATTATKAATGWLACRNGKTYLDVVAGSTGNVKPGFLLEDTSGALTTDVPELREVMFDGFNTFGVF